MPARVMTVAADGSGDVTTVADALGRTDISQILVRPGTYDGGFELPSDISLIGDGERTSVEIRSKVRPCVVAQGSGAIRNLTLVGLDAAALAIRSGSLLVEDCVLASIGAPAVLVSGAAADPQLTRCSFERDTRSLQEGEGWEGAPAGSVAPTGGGSAGSMKAYLPEQPQRHPNCAVLISDDAKGHIVGCDVHVGAAPVGGVLVESGADPRFERCRIGNGDSFAIHVRRARGSFEGCTVNAHWWVGIATDSQADPVFRRCRIVGGHTGISVFDASGTFEDCEITAWMYEDDVPGQGGPQRPGERMGGPIGILIGQAGDPTIRGAWVHDRGGHALVLEKGAGGLVEGCRFERTAKGGISKAWRVKTRLERNLVE